MGQGQNQAPKFVYDMDNLKVSEAKKVGDEIATLKATDPENDPIEYGIVADMFEVRNPRNGKVYLTREINYEVSEPCSYVFGPPRP